MGARIQKTNRSRNVLPKSITRDLVMERINGAMSAIYTLESSLSTFLSREYDPDVSAEQAIEQYGDDSYLLRQAVELSTHLDALQQFDTRVELAHQECTYLLGCADVLGLDTSEELRAIQSGLRLMRDALISDMLLTAALQTTAILGAFLEPDEDVTIDAAKKRKSGAVLSGEVEIALSTMLPGLDGLRRDLELTAKAEVESRFLRQFATYQKQRVAILEGMVQSLLEPIQ